MAVSGLVPPFRASAQVFTNLHSLVFTNGTGPVASLLLSGDTVYGTTRIYGGGDGGGYGSVFKMAADGSSFTALHIFSDYAPEGGNLNSSLILSGGMLYGTAAFGGGLDHGCVFGISTNGAVVTNVYSFTPLSADFPSTNSDGAYPIAGLVLSGSRFYGMANGGGVYGWGPSSPSISTERVLPTCIISPSAMDSIPPRTSLYPAALSMVRRPAAALSITEPSSR
jgi:hypothetical protein